MELIRNSNLENNLQSITISDKSFSAIGNTGVFIGGWKSRLAYSDFDIVVNCTENDPHVSIEKDCFYLKLDIPEGKRGLTKFYQIVPSFIQTIHSQIKKYVQFPRIMIHCAQGKDRSVGIALCVFLSLFRFDIITDSPILLNDEEQEEIDKKLIQRWLLYIQRFRPVASPSRNLLQRIHSLFIKY